MRNLNEVEVNAISGGGDMGPDPLPPLPQNQNIGEFVREWNAMHPHNPLPISD